jgi:hypothetical protein
MAEGQITPSRNVKFPNQEQEHRMNTKFIALRGERHGTLPSMLQGESHEFRFARTDSASLPINSAQKIC